MSAALEAAIAAQVARTGRRPRILEQAVEATPGEDVVYPLGGGRHAYITQGDGAARYLLVEPQVADHEAGEIATLREGLALAAAAMGDAQRDGSLAAALLTLLRESRPEAHPETDPVTYRLLNELAGFGPLDGLLGDPALEDIHVVGTNPVHVIHRRFGMLETNVRFPDTVALLRFLRLLCERLGRPVSDAIPIVDAVLPNGSRLNLVYSEDVSRRGPSLSIRRVTDEPVSITRLVQWGTLSAEAAAYLWLCLEHGMSAFLCGEAACGKTTTLNAILPFIDRRAKIFSAEDTPEVTPPHPVWQRLLTRETGPEASQVRMFDLLKAGLRSRPDYIVVGEIRGAEGAVAFQAMQTGHPTLATFHATDPTSLVQRLGSAPINVPMTFMDNLNLVVFQEQRRIGGRPQRRVTRIVEIAGSAADGVTAVPVFQHDVASDQLRFQGLFNSHLLEAKVATVRGMEDTRQVYTLLAQRAKVIQAMVQNGVLGAQDVARAIALYSRGGEAALPFAV